MAGSQVTNVLALGEHKTPKSANSQSGPNLRAEIVLPKKKAFFHSDFGKEFPSRTLWRDPPQNCNSPSSALCPFLYRTVHFSRGRKWRKGAEKEEEEGWPAKRAKRKKGRVKTGQ